MSDCHSQVWTSTVLWNSKVPDVYKQPLYGFLHCNFSQEENDFFFLSWWRCFCKHRTMWQISYCQSFNPVKLSSRSLPCCCVCTSATVNNNIYKHSVLSFSLSNLSDEKSMITAHTSRSAAWNCRKFMTSVSPAVFALCAFIPINKLPVFNSYHSPHISHCRREETTIPSSSINQTAFLPCNDS